MTDKEKLEIINRHFAVHGDVLDGKPIRSELLYPQKGTRVVTDNEFLRETWSPYLWWRQ